jgi:hypothetical protein
MISPRNLKLPIGSSRAKKFTSRASVPFTLTDIVANGPAYTLKLLTHMGLHLTFHVGLLKPYLRGSRINRDARPLNPTSSRTATKNGKWKPSSITAARAAGENQPTSLSGVVSHFSKKDSWLAVRQPGNAKDLLTPYQSRIVAAQLARALRGRSSN